MESSRWLTAAGRYAVLQFVTGSSYPPAILRASPTATIHRLAPTRRTGWKVTRHSVNMVGYCRSRYPSGVEIASGGRCQER